MIDYDQARALIEAAGRACPAPGEYRRTPELDGRIAAETVTAPRSIQPFDNSAMDGFAVRCDDLAGADQGGVTLTRRDTVAAGEPAGGLAPAAGECVAIMTGAPVPEGLDAVVPVEQVEANGATVRFHAMPAEGANIRRAGEDFRAGDPVWQAGDLLGPAQMMAAAGLGIAGARVLRRPRSAFIATGKELVDDFDRPLAEGEIYNSNRIYAEQILARLGTDYSGGRTIRDDRSEFRDHVRALMDDGVEIIVSSGAVSAGEFDFVRPELEALGAEILFHKVRIKPGKPNLFARLPNGSLYFGLPGNPVATAAGLRFFVAPVLDAMAGRPAETPGRARLVNGLSKRTDLRLFLKARVRGAPDGLAVELLDGQASFMTSPMLAMNAWAVAPEEHEQLEPGMELDIYPVLPDGHWPRTE